jgi:hypothetical protein
MDDLLLGRRGRADCSCSPKGDRKGLDRELQGLSGPTCRYTPFLPISPGSMAVLLMTYPSGAILPTGKQTVEVSPRDFARLGAMMTSSGLIPSCSRRFFLNVYRRALSCHQSRQVSSVAPATVFPLVSRRPARRRCSMTSGVPPARKTCTVEKFVGPFGSASTSRGT